MAFKYENFKNVGLDHSASPATYSYLTNDALSLVLSVGYFSDSRAEIQLGDTIILNCADAQVSLVAVSGDTAIKAESATEYYINKESDLPNVSAGVSTLEPNICYKFANGLTLDIGGLIPSEGTVLQGCGTFSTGVTMTTDGDCITTLNTGYEVRGLSITAPNCNQVINSTGTFLDAFLATSFRINGTTKLGTFTGQAPVMSYTAFTEFEDGWTLDWDGVNPVVGLAINNSFMESHPTTGTNAVFFDFGSSQFLDLKMEEISMFGPGASRLKSSVNGANIIPLSEAEINECNFSTDGSPVTIFDGFTDGFQTNNWSFRRNSPLYLTEPSNFNADMFLLTQNTITVGGGNQGVFLEIGTPGAGVWQSKAANRFTLNSAGYLEYTGDRDIAVIITCTASITKTGGGADELEGRIGVNFPTDADGLDDSKMETVSADFGGVTMITTTTLSPGDTVRPIFANNSSTKNIEVAHVKLSVRLE